jgi:hypothetical protein
MKDEFRHRESQHPITLAAVPDTNCMMRISSWAHVADALLHAESTGSGTLQDPQVAFRCRQAEDLFRLSLYLHERKMATYSVASEFGAFVHFIKDELFYGGRP